MTSSVLSYFEEYFTPHSDALLSGHSTWQIARHIQSLLDRRGTCQYVPQQPVGGLCADVFVGHFWSFLDYCRHNTFERAIAILVSKSLSKCSSVISPKARKSPKPALAKTISIRRPVALTVS
jgi:hypothetical protein